MRSYVDFDQVTRDAFRSTAASLGLDLRSAEAGLLDAYRKLPAFADTAEALVRLAESRGTGWWPSATGSPRR